MFMTCRQLQMIDRCWRLADIGLGYLRICARRYACGGWDARVDAYMYEMHALGDVRVGGMPASARACLECTRRGDTRVGRCPLESVRASDGMRASLGRWVLATHASTRVFGRVWNDMRASFGCLYISP